MNVREWQALRRLVHEDFYNDLITTADCGAFDGGCVVVAEALQRVIGGEIVVLVREDESADHAAVLCQGKLWDYNGPMLPRQFIARFNRAERANTVGYRPIQDEDLREAYRDEELAARLVEKFRAMLEEKNVNGESCSVSPAFR
jgi:hypothetical protein